MIDKSYFNRELNPELDGHADGLLTLAPQSRRIDAMEFDHEYPIGRNRFTWAYANCPFCETENVICYEAKKGLLSTDDFGSVCWHFVDIEHIPALDIGGYCTITGMRFTLSD